MGETIGRWSKVAVLLLGAGLPACTLPADGGLASDWPVAPGKPALDSYAWLDRSDALLDAIADAPPDYTFDLGGRQLFAWEVNGSLIVEEPDAAGYRLYLFDRGASLPYFVRTPDLAIGYDGREPAVAYLRDGRLLTGADLWRYRSEADAFQRRAREVRQAASYSQWDEEDAWAWSRAQPVVVELRHRWHDGWRQDRDWAEYRRRSDAEAARAGLAGERRRRLEAGERFRRWRDGARPAPSGTGGRTDRPRPRRPLDGAWESGGPETVRPDLRDPVREAAPVILAPEVEPAPTRGVQDRLNRPERSERPALDVVGEPAANPEPRDDDAEAARARRQAADAEQRQQAEAAERVETERAARAAAEVAARRRAAEEAAAEEARRQAEREEADARARAEQQRRGPEQALEPQ